MSLKKLGLAVAGAAAAGAVVLGGATLADAATKTSATADRGGHGHPGGTQVTGDELAKVTAAVKAKDATATVDRVRKDRDGSYHVLATRSGDRVRYEVSANLTTVTEHQGRGPGGDRGPRAGTEVTGDELAKVTAAVKTKDAAVTVDTVRKVGDGSYRVLATKNGNRVMYKVSADLTTITEHQGRGPGRGHRPHR